MEEEGLRTVGTGEAGRNCSVAPVKKVEQRLNLSRKPSLTQCTLHSWRGCVSHRAARGEDGLSGKRWEKSPLSPTDVFPGSLPQGESLPGRGFSRLAQWLIPRCSELPVVFSEWDLPHVAWEGMSIYYNSLFQSLHVGTRVRTHRDLNWLFLSKPIQKKRPLILYLNLTSVSNDLLQTQLAS